MKDRRLWRGAAIIIGLAIAGTAIWFSPLRAMFDAVALLRIARSYGDAWWAVPAFIALYSLLDILFIPAQPLAVAATLIWGWMAGGFIDLVAATIGAVFPFLIARSALREPIARRLARHEAMSRILQREGFTLLLVLRVVPIIPYTLLNYVAGLASLRLGQYLVATFVGMIPSAFIFAYFVEALIEGAVEPRAVVLRGLGAGILFAALIVATRVAAPKVRAWIESKQRTTSPPAGADRD